VVLLFRNHSAVPAPINAANATASIHTIVGGPLFVDAGGGARTIVADAIADFGGR
jgi:hypothetical protein